MEVSLTTHGVWTVVTPHSARLDAHDAPRLKQFLRAAIPRGNSNVVFDLSHVELMDSSGLAVVISGLKAARLAGGDLRIARPTDQVRFLFELTGLDRVMRLYPTVEEALVGY